MIATTQQILHNGARNAVVQLTGISDGSGRETRVPKVDVKALGAKSVSVRKITYQIGYGVVTLSWDALTPVDVAQLPDGYGEIDYRKIGGMKPRMDLGGATGNILLSTTGFDLGSSYTITIEMVKKT